MHDETDDYEQGKRHIAEAEERIARQKHIIDELIVGGHDPTDAADLLVTMESSLKLMQAHLRQIEAIMAEQNSSHSR